MSKKGAYIMCNRRHPAITNELALILLIQVIDAILPTEEPYNLHKVREEVNMVY